MTITISHTDGPLAGQQQTFDDSVGAVLFGRDREEAQVVYPPAYDIVGRRHFELRRTRAGDYTVELFGSRYVEMNGKPVDNGTPVKSGSRFRLGRKDGPGFKVEIGAPSVQGLPVTADQRTMTTSSARLGRTVGVGGTLLALVVAGALGYVFFLQATLSDEIALARAEAAERAEKEFRQADLTRLRNAVYLVAREDGGAAEAAGTAWAFQAGDPQTGTPGKLATNAHVTEAIDGHEKEFFLVGPDGEKIAIAKVVSHPGYQAFKSKKTTIGTTRWGAFTPLDLINEYDVGIIEVAPDAKLPETLSIAPPQALEALTPGTPVASVGFPVEGLAGSDTAPKAPGQLRFGHISALTDVFMVRAEPEHQLLIQHSVPVTGGASGSPLIAPSGEVIGIVNGGNTTVFKNKNEAMNAKVRVPSAALINFAQRADLLQELARGQADDALAEDKTYWESQGAQFDDYFDVAAAEFVKLAKSRYDVDKATETMIAGGDEAKLVGHGDRLKLVSKTYTRDVEPGKIYGFIADSKSGIPIGINVKDKATASFLRDAKDPRQTSELELAPTAWITVDEPKTVEIIVWSLVDQPAEYELFAYEWPKPDPSPSADAGS
jgi:Trypsin-like peptidase domain/FHA domain